VTAPAGRRLYTAILISGGGTLLAMALALSLLMIGSVIGPFRLFAGRSAYASQGLGLWLTPSSDSMAPRERALRLAAWRSAVSGTAELSEGRSLTGFESRGVRVVAVADPRALSAPELRLLEGFLASGGGVILTGAFGVQGEHGQPRDTAAMRRLLRVARVTLDARGDSPALASARRGPLAAALAPGQRLALAAGAILPGIDDPKAELVWLGAPPGAGEAASLRLDHGAGRLLWLAAGPAEIAGDGEVGSDGKRLLAAAYAWAAREPFAEVLAPEPPVAGEQPDAEAWERLRDQVAVRVERTGPHRSLIEVTNRDAEPRAGLLLRVYLNTSTADVQVGRTTLQQEEPDPIFDWPRNQVDVALPELAAGASRAYTFDVEPLSARARN
jgi:hypothetical protein